MTRTVARSITAALSVITLCGMSLIEAKDAAYSSKAGHFAVTLPIGWVRDDRGPFLAITRDGFNLHRMVVRRAEFKEAFAGVLKAEKEKEGKQRRIAADTPPEELAELYIAEVRASNEAVAVVTNEPAVVGGLPAAHLVFEFANQNGLRLRVEGFVLVAASGFFELAYIAPQLHFAARDQRAFDALVASFAYREPPAKKKR